MLSKNSRFWKLVHAHRISVAIAALAVVEIIVNFFFQYDIFRNILMFLHDPHHLLGSEILLYIIVAGSAYYIDKSKKLRIAKQENKINEERINAARIILSTVHDTVNNHLNGLLLVRLEAEKGIALSREMLQIFDNQVSLISSDLRKLGELDIIEERDLSSGIAVVNTKILEL